jgi:hypothetical protein
LENFGWDLLIVLSLCLIGIAFAHASYRFGRPVWPENFLILDFEWKHSGIISSGELGEWANIGVIAAILVVLLVLTPEANLVDVIATRWPIFLLLAVLSVLGIALYASGAVAKVKNETFKRPIKKTPEAVRVLGVGYRWYVGYCLMIAMLIWAIVGLTFTQFIMDKSAFEILAREIFQRLDVVGTIPNLQGEELLLAFEVAFGQQRIAEGYILDQVNSSLMLLLCVALAYLAIYKTPIRHVYADDALAILNMILFVLLGACILLGCWVFFSVHLVFADRLLAVFRAHSALMNAGPWQLTQRYQDLVAQLTQQRGIFGFLVALTTNRGGLVLLIPALQFLLSMRGDARGSKAKASA